MLNTAVTRRRLALAVFAGCLLLAVVVSVLEPTRYRAEATVVVGGTPRQPTAGDAAAMKTLRELVGTEVVLRSALDALDVRDLSPDALARRVHVRVPEGTSLLVISVDDGDHTRAAQLAHELGLVFTQLALQRFPRLQASLFGNARVLPGHVSPRWTRNLAVGAIIGALLALLVLLVPARLPVPAQRQAEEATPAPTRPAPEPEPAREAQPPVPRTDPEAAVEPEPEPEPEPERPKREPELLLEPRPGEWNIRVLGQLVEERADEFPDDVDVWRAYVLALSAQADSSGVLPQQLDPLVRDTFEPLLGPVHRRR